MPRTLNANAITNVTSSEIYSIFLVSLQFDSPVYVHNDVGTITHQPPHLSAPVNYQGVGSLGSVSAIPETSKIAANFIDLKLSGIPNSLISTAINTNYQGKTAYIEIGLINPNTHQIIDTPTTFGGFIDTLDLNIGSTASITVKVIDQLVRFDKSSNRRWNDNDQKSDYPTDNCFTFQKELKEQILVWGGTRNV